MNMYSDRNLVQVKFIINIVNFIKNICLDKNSNKNSIGDQRFEIGQRCFDTLRNDWKED